MIAMKLDVVTAADTVAVTITPRVQVEFERHYQMGIAKAFSEEMRVEHIYFLAWKAMHYAGQTTATFDAWLDSVLDVQMAGVDVAPFDPDRLAGS